MKNCLLIAAACVLAGCAATPGQNYYGAGVPRAHLGEALQWRVVSVTPVPAGTGARFAASNPNGSSADYTSVPIMVAPPLPYQPAPVYQEPPGYLAFPITLSLGFMLGRHWGFGYRGHRRHH